METEKKNGNVLVNSVEDFPRAALSAIDLAPYPVMKFGCWS